MTLRITKNTWITLVKVLVGAILAIIIAMLIGLKNPTSAGIVTILTILPFKKETIFTAIERGVCFIVSVLLAYLSFLLGFHVWSYLLFLVLYLSFCGIFSFYSSMSINAVLMAHFLSYQEMTWELIINEALLFVLGVFIGIALNLTLNPERMKYQKKKERMDDEIKHILLRVSERIENIELENFDGSCLKKLEDYIDETKEVATFNEKNSFKSKKEELEYVQMRKRQYRVLVSIVGLVKRVSLNVSTSKEVASYVKDVASSYHEKNDVIELLDKLNALRKKMEESPLPLDRNEFEQRARLYYLFDLLEDFLIIKKEYSLSISPRK